MNMPFTAEQIDPTIPLLCGGANRQLNLAAQLGQWFDKTSEPLEVLAVRASPAMTAWLWHFFSYREGVRLRAAGEQISRAFPPRGAAISSPPPVSAAAFVTLREWMEFEVGPFGPGSMQHAEGTFRPERMPASWKNAHLVFMDMTGIPNGEPCHRWMKWAASSLRQGGYAVFYFPSSAPLHVDFTTEPHDAEHVDTFGRSAVERVETSPQRVTASKVVATKYGLWPIGAVQPVKYTGETSAPTPIVQVGERLIPSPTSPTHHQFGPDYYTRIAQAMKPLVVADHTFGNWLESRKPSGTMLLMTKRTD